MITSRMCIYRHNERLKKLREPNIGLQRENIIDKYIYRHTYLYINKEMAYMMMKKKQNEGSLQATTYISWGALMMMMCVVWISLLVNIEPAEANCGPYVAGLCTYGGDSIACDAYCKTCHPRFIVCGSRTDCTSCTNCTGGYCVGRLCSCNNDCSSSCSN